jgi:hypothetical protein
VIDRVEVAVGLVVGRVGMRLRLVEMKRTKVAVAAEGVYLCDVNVNTKRPGRSVGRSINWWWRQAQIVVRDNVRARGPDIGSRQVEGSTTDQKQTDRVVVIVRSIRGLTSMRSRFVHIQVHGLT